MEIHAIDCCTGTSGFPEGELRVPVAERAGTRLNSEPGLGAELWCVWIAIVEVSTKESSGPGIIRGESPEQWPKPWMHGATQLLTAWNELRTTTSTNRRF